MADKKDKDMACFLGYLENLVLQYKAFRCMAKGSDPKWAVALSRYRKANGVHIAKGFDPIRADVQERHFDAAIERLVDLMKKLLASEQ